MPALDMPLSTVWSQVQEVREKMKTLLHEYSPEVQSAVTMTVSELVENAVKYGESVPRSPCATVSLDLTPARITVTIRNGVTSLDVVSDLVSHIDRIKGASDRHALYVECLRQAMMSSDGRSRLGIYRIGCEGGFDLDSSYEEQVLTITASREI